MTQAKYPSLETRVPGSPSLLGKPQSPPSHPGGLPQPPKHTPCFLPPHPLRIFHPTSRVTFWKQKSDNNMTLFKICQWICTQQKLQCSDLDYQRSCMTQTQPYPSDFMSSTHSCHWAFFSKHPKFFPPKGPHTIFFPAWSVPPPPHLHF